MSLLLLLPKELTIKIFLYLDVGDAYTIQAVNHTVRNIYKSSVQLQYALECKVAHVRDNPNCLLPIGERLEVLRRREAAWLSMEPTISQTTPMPKDTDLNDIERNHYIFGRCGYGLHSITIRESGSLYIHHIQIDGLVDFRCCIDEHDLIACLIKTVDFDYEIEFTVKLIQHSTGLAHPLAAIPSISVCRDVYEEASAAEASMSMEIFGENLVLTLAIEGGEQDSFTRLYTFNWKTGAAICLPIPVSNIGIIVLDKDLVLVPDNNDWLLRVYYIPSSQVNEPPRAVHQLRLPALKRDVTVDWYQCRCSPNPTGDGEFPRYIPPSLPFMDQPETALIYFQYCIGSEYLSMVVHRHSIMNLLPSCADWSTISEPRTMDWNDWGPPITSWDKTSLTIPHFGATNGQRYIQTTEQHYGQPYLQDYNKYSVKRCSTEKPSTCVPEHIFLDPIRSELPFIRICATMRALCGYFSLADDLILGTQSHLIDDFHGDDDGDTVYIFYLA